MTINTFVPEKEKEKTRPFDVNLMRNQALYRAAQLLCHIPAPPCMTIHDKCLLWREEIVCAAITSGTNMQFRNADVWAGCKGLSADYGWLSGTLT